MTDAYAEIPAGEESAEVQATAMEAGKAGNALPEGSITKIVDPLPYIAKVRNRAQRILTQIFRHSRAVLFGRQLSSLQQEQHPHHTRFRRIWRDVNPSELIKRVISAGAKRVELTEPIFCQIDESSIAALAAETIVYGGLEDD